MQTYLYFPVEAPFNTLTLILRVYIEVNPFQVKRLALHWPNEVRERGE